VLESALDAHWARDLSLTAGSALPVGRYTLERGLARIVCADGAEIIVEGPATFTLDSGRQISLAGGRLVGACRTEHSRGFTALTRNARLVDLGTEFGIAVLAEGTTETEVFDGRVALAAVSRAEPGPAATVTLGRGQTARIARDSTVVTTAIPLQTVFTRREHWERRQAWLACRDALVNDPSVIAYYAFEPSKSSSRVLRESRGQRLFDGAIRTAPWTPGRFPGKLALDFAGRETPTRVELGQAASTRLNLTGSFTVAAWFNIRANHTGWATLLCKGNHAWRLQLNRHDQLGFYISSPEPETDYVFNRPWYGALARTPVADGRWHLAVVTGDVRDGATATRLYLDGVLLDERDLPPMPRNDDPVWFGANSGSTESYVIDGKLDEILFVSRVLSAEEIVRLYDAGKPAEVAQQAGQTHPDRKEEMNAEPISPVSGKEVAY